MNRLMKSFLDKNKMLKMLEFLYPPVGMWRANFGLEKKIKKQEESYQQIFNEFVKNTTSKSYPNELFSEIDKVEQGEIHRKEMLESKASSLLNTLGISITLIVLVPAILGKNWELPQCVAIVGASFFTLAVVHLLIAVYYAVKVTKVVSYYLKSADSVEDWIQNDPKKLVNLIAAEKFTNTKVNQPRLIIKSNCLIVAQALFIRGIVFFGIGALVVLMYSIIG